MGKPIKDKDDAAGGGAEDKQEDDSAKDHESEVLEENVEEKDESQNEPSKDTSERSKMTVEPRRRSKRLEKIGPICFRDLFFCEYCSEDCKTEAALLEHKQTNHIEELAMEEEEDQTEECTRYSKERKRSFKCAHCGWRFSAKMVLLSHIKQEHSDGETDKEKCVDEDDGNTDWYSLAREEQADYLKHAKQFNKRRHRSLECPFCIGSYSSIEVLQDHMMYCKEDYTEKRQKADDEVGTKAVKEETEKNVHLFCKKCGQVFKSKEALVHHHIICCASIEANSGIEDGDVIDIDDANVQDDSSGEFAPPAAKRPFLDSSVNKMIETQSIPPEVPVDPFVNTVTEMKKEVEDAELIPESPLEQPEPFGQNIETTVKAEDDDDIMIIDEKPVVQNIMKPSVAGNKIQKDRQSLSVGIHFLTEKEPNESIPEDDLIVAARDNPNNVIICIKRLDFFKLTEEQRKLISASKQITFLMTEKEKTFTVWSVITFCEENCPVALENQMFNTFNEVEKVISSHAEAHGKTVHNVMRYAREGLFPMLSSSLQNKITAFNFPG